MIHRVLAPNPGLMTGAGTNTYLVDGGGGTLAVIDPGPDDPQHLDAILRAAEPLGQIRAVLVTHHHGDHLPAALPLARRTGAPLLGHRDLPGVERPLADGERLGVGSRSLQALETPGHTDDSLCFWDADAGALFTGDVIAGAGTVIVDDAPGGLARYLRSLARLRTLGACQVYPGHGPVVADGLAKIGEYLAHRGQREQQVLGQLRGGAREVEEIVAAVYPDVQPGLRGMAARNVRAHLDKLRGEGRVRATASGAWQLTS